MKCHLFITLGGLILLTSCMNHQMGIVKEFENLFDKKFDPDQPGGVVLIRKNDKVVFLKNYGLADLDRKEKITPNTIFNTGSISKTFVSYGILMLQESGLLSVEDSLSQYFKDFDHPKIADQVKLKHLMTHTSGLPDSRNVADEFEFYLTAKDEENFKAIKKTNSFNFKPGEKFEYSNPAFNGLALIIEQVSNQKWQSFIQDNIFLPAGMNHSKITDGPYPQQGVAHGYVFEDDAYTEMDYGEEPTFAAAGNGGVWCSVLDLARYEDAIRHAAFISPTSIEESRQIQQFENWDSAKSPEVGLSWFIAEENHEDNEFDLKIISHTGWQGGFRGFMISIPEKDILYIGLFNRPLSDMSESFNPFTATHKYSNDVRIAGIRILQSYNWLEP